MIEALSDVNAVSMPSTAEVVTAAAPLRQRHPRLTLIGVALVGLVASGYLTSGRNGNANAASVAVAPVPAKAVTVVAVEEPATLVPLTLAARTPAADEVFATRLMNFSITLDRLRRDAVSHDLPRAEAALLKPDVVDALGPNSAAALRNLTTVAREAARAPALDEPSVTALDIATARLDNALLADKLPYFVDTSVMANRKNERIIVFYEFSIIESNLFESGSSRVRSVRVRRLDRLNWKHTSLGFVNPHRAQAAVLLDQIDDQLDRHVAPALMAGASMPFVSGRNGRAAAAAGVFTSMAARAGEDARTELGELPTPTLDTPGGGPDREVAYAALREAFADSIERHEVQHRLDLLSPIPTPHVVMPLVRGESRAAEDMRDAIKNELSAYVAQIARDERMPRTTLTLLLRFLVNPRTRTSTEAYVAMITAEELARELGIANVAPLLTLNGQIDEARLVRAHRELTAVPPDRLSNAARSVWTRLFERELAPLSRVRP